MMRIVVVRIIGRCVQSFRVTFHGAHSSGTLIFEDPENALQAPPHPFGHRVIVVALALEIVFIGLVMRTTMMRPVRHERDHQSNSVALPIGHRRPPAKRGIQGLPPPSSGRPHGEYAASPTFAFRVVGLIAVMRPLLRAKTQYGRHRYIAIFEAASRSPRAEG